MRAGRPSTSAQTVATCRAVLSARGVVDDRFAMGMLHRPHQVLAWTLRTRPLRPLAESPTFTFLAARTLFFDDQLVTALDDDIAQAVIVGAGYDSRAWRFARAGVRFFEVDHPATQYDKRTRAPKGGLTYVAADLNSDRLDALLPANGLRVAQRTVFIVEGLTMYLPENTVRIVLSDLAAVAAPGSRLAVNFTVQGGGSVSPVSQAIAWLTRLTWRFRGEPTHRWVRRDRLSKVLTDTGWMTTTILPAPDLASRYLEAGSRRVDGLNPGAICVAADRSSA